MRPTFCVRVAQETKLQAGVKQQQRDQYREHQVSCDQQRFEAAGDHLSALPANIADE